MSSVESYLSIERRLDANSEWAEMLRLPGTTSVDYGRVVMGRIEPVLPTAEHRLVWTKIVTTREVVDQ